MYPALLSFAGLGAGAGAPEPEAPALRGWPCLDVVSTTHIIILVSIIIIIIIIIVIIFIFIIIIISINIAIIVIIVIIILIIIMILIYFVLLGAGHGLPARVRGAALQAGEREQVNARLAEYCCTSTVWNLEFDETVPLCFSRIYQ